MKKILSIILCVVLAVAVMGCEEATPHWSTTVRTEDATNITRESVTFNASVTFRSDSGIIGEAGFFYDNKPTVSKTSYMFTTTPVLLSQGVTPLSVTENLFIETVLQKTYTFAPGETCYYVSYVRVTSGDFDFYQLGEVKSFIVPEK